MRSDSRDVSKKRLRTNRKLIAAELKKLTALSAEKGGRDLPRTAMCLGAAYALGWVSGEFSSPSQQIAKALERKESSRKPVGVKDAFLPLRQKVWEDFVTDATLRRFILGQVDEKERQRIEELFLTDTQVRTNVLIEEDELIEDYLEGTLSATDKESFTARYMRTPALKRRIRIAESIKRAAVRQGGSLQ